MSSSNNTQSGSGGPGGKRGKGKNVHLVHSATSWRLNSTAESSSNAENTNASGGNNTTGVTTTNPGTDVALPPRAPAPEIEFPEGCMIFPLVPAAYGRNQARRALHLAAQGRPDAWVGDLAKPIIRDANKRRGAFTKTPREEGRDNEIYRWEDEGLDELQLGLIANAPDVG
ncbi:hypothetical protein FKW77_001302 [Venturia effusa]|uniref:Uncharacterized protein n=1 Tax=Venturia effusa TaxID=50376 RepID=A0A517LNC3_9PEZI|nr:hypothetical protein FKW77_001302 [Venturia effusa]